MAEIYIPKILSQLPQDKHDLFLSRYNAAKKNLTTAFLLSFFVGGYGAHKFYLGQKNLGWAYLLFIWTFIPSILGIIEAFRISAQVTKYNIQKALEMASEISKIKMDVGIGQPAKDVVYKLISDFDFRQQYFDSPSAILNKYKLTELENKAFARINRHSFDRISTNASLETLAGLSDNVIVNQHLAVVSESVNFLTINSSANLCPNCLGSGSETIISKSIIGELKENQTCSYCIGHGFLLQQLAN